MTPNTRRTPGRAGRTTAHVFEALLVLALACLAAGFAWVIAGSVGISLLTGAIFGLLGSLWAWRTVRTGRTPQDEHAGDPRGAGSRPIAEERRRRGQGGAFDQPGTSGFGTPGLGG
jgi:membrane protein implicated in regulation of membrane protease activity